MKIEPFKMKVTPAQSRRVQEIVFENGGEWRDHTRDIIRTEKPFLGYGIRDNTEGLSYWSSKGSGRPLFSEAGVPELTFNEFLTKYEKPMSELKLEVGKTYLNRKGERVKIVKKTGKKTWMFKGDNDFSFTNTGAFQSPLIESDQDLISEVPTALTYKIPENTREISVNEIDGQIVIEFVPASTPEVRFKEGDIVFEDGRIMIVAAYPNQYKVLLSPNGWVSNYNGGYGLPFTAPTFRFATPAEEQQLFDSLAKDGNRWNAETLELEEFTERDRIRAFFVKRRWGLSEAMVSRINEYIKQREAQQ